MHTKKARNYFRGTGTPEDHLCMLQLEVLLPDLTHRGWPSAARSTSCTGGNRPEDALGGAESKPDSDLVITRSLKAALCPAPIAAFRDHLFFSSFSTAAEKVRLDCERCLLGKRSRAGLSSELMASSVYPT